MSRSRSTVCCTSCSACARSGLPNSRGGR
jgi:hypothetical protein